MCSPTSPSPPSSPSPAGSSRAGPSSSSQAEPAASGTNELPTISLPILHFNDVYRVTQKYTPPSEGTGGAEVEGGGEQQYISAAQFGQQLQSLRAEWAEGKDGKREGLVLFSGDVFSPSVESTITRGSHMVPLLNTFDIDCSVTGNHDFDHSFAHLTKLIGDCNFPWLLSNIIDTHTDKIPEPLLECVILPRMGLKIGIIGLVEADWIATIPSFPPYFKHVSMADTALRLSKHLREKEGVDLVIALTHCRVGNDLQLAEEIGAVAGLGPDAGHGADLILGGHDHIYYVGRGATSWEGWERPDELAGTEGDKRALVIKSGTDFRDLSSFTLTLTPQPPSSIRRYLITSLTGTHHTITPSTPTSVPTQQLIDSLLGKVSATLSTPACYTLTEWDVRSEIVRTGESAIGDWLADVLMHSYSEALEEKGAGRIDLVLNCGGTLRGDSRYGPGVVTLGDVLEILPFEDPVVVIQMSGNAIWECLESGLGKWPAHEGRFPVIAGMEVTWSSTSPPGQRVKSVELVSHRKAVADRLGQPADEGGESDDEEDSDASEGGEVVQLAEGVECELKKKTYRHREPIKREKGGRSYNVVTREYMAEGYDGFDAMRGSTYLIDDENGQLMSNIVRHFLLGSSYLLRKSQLTSAAPGSPVAATHSGAKDGEEEEETNFLSSRTGRVVSKHQKRTSEGAGVAEGGGGGPTVARHGWKSIRDALRVARFEHMSGVDGVDGSELRKLTPSDCAPPPAAVQPKSGEEEAGKEKTMPASSETLVEGKKELKGVGRGLEKVDGKVAVVAPVRDGRLRDLGRGE